MVGKHRPVLRLLHRHRLIHGDRHATRGEQSQPVGTLGPGAAAGNHWVPLRSPSRDRSQGNRGTLDRRPAPLFEPNLHWGVWRRGGDHVYLQRS
mgnify:CR=1 FL=1